MILGAKYYCEYAKGDKLLFEVGRLDKVENGVMYIVTKNRTRKVNVHTGEELESEVFKVWLPLDSEAKIKLHRSAMAKKARKWFKKMMELDDTTLDIYKRIFNPTNIDFRREIQTISDPERYRLKEQSVQWVKENYKPPHWCGHPNALSGVFGCTKLMELPRVKRGECMMCECYVEAKRYEVIRRLRMLSRVTVRQMNMYLEISDYEDIELGNREPTQKEVALINYLFAMDDWTIEEVRYFNNTIAGEDRFTDPMVIRYGNMVRNKINQNNTLYDYKKIKNW
jgi:hypothetical protein